MDSFGYNRCEECDEDNFLRDGAKCARCLSLTYVPVDDDDNEEESSRFSFADLAAA
jgi:hypothetical protein